MRVAAIETTYVAQTKRTVWRVLAAGEVLATGHVPGDPSGVRAIAEANAWIAASGFEPGEWRHAVDRTGAHDSTPPAGVRAWQPVPAAPARSTEASIETTYHHARRQTSWRVIVDREVIAKGVVTDDVTGSRAQEAAERYLAALSLGATRWSHTNDRTPGRDELVFGLVRCASGSDVPIAVTDQQLEELRGRTLICPGCGDYCAPQFETSEVPMPAVFAWNGARWAGIHRS